MMQKESQRVWDLENCEAEALQALVSWCYCR